MSPIDCPQCGKPHPATGSQTIEGWLCECGTSLTVPSSVPQTTGASATCPTCKAPVESDWISCPKCAAPLSPQPTTPSKIPAVAEIQTGDNSVVKAQIDKSTNIAGTGPTTGTPAASAPLINVGAESVVKAHIDQSINVHQEGQFIEQQTVVYEASVSALVQMLTRDFSTHSAAKIQDTLPEDPNKLFSILAQTLRHILREAKLTFKQNEGLFSAIARGWAQRPSDSSKEALQADGKERVRIAKEESETKKKRIELCRSILDKLHDQAHETNQADFVEDVEHLDECLISIERFQVRQSVIAGAKKALIFGTLCLPVLYGIAIVDSGHKANLALALVVTGIVGGGYWLLAKTQSDISTRMAGAEQTVKQLTNSDV